MKNKLEKILKDNTSEETSEKVMSFINKVSVQLEKIDDKLSMKQLLMAVKVMMVVTALGFGVFYYWNHNLNAGRPGTIDITNKDLREVQQRTFIRWGGGD